MTQGTVANGMPNLIAPTFAGLAGEDVQVVVTTGGRPIEDMQLGPLPATARVGTFLSYPELLPRTDAMVTNGGYGGTQQALSYGIPRLFNTCARCRPRRTASTDQSVVLFYERLPELGRRSYVLVRFCVGFCNVTTAEHNFQLLYLS